MGLGGNVGDAGTMRYSRLSANLVGLVVVPGLLISACGDDATSGAEPCSGADCAGAPATTGGTKADNTSGKSGNTSGGKTGNGMGGDAAAGDTSVDPIAGSGAGGEPAGDAGANQGGMSSSGAGGQPDQVELLADGAECVASRQCGSGHCEEGLCCNAECGDDCFSCVGAETGGEDGQCLPVTAGTDPGDDCDANDYECQGGNCNGSGACQKAADGTICRGADGECDVAELCSNGACPTDSVKIAETSCRAAAGVCDVAELCNGLDKACPANVFSTASVEACPGYKCSGAAADCPTSCQTKADCSPARFCSENQCILGKRVFVTSTTHLANFGALSNADAICNARAQEAGLFGTYMAWVSSTTSNIATRSSHAAFKYYRLDGTTPYVIANDWADLINGTTVAIATDENGIVRGNEPVFTGTESNGVVATNNCQNWSTVAGNVTFAAGNSSAAATNVPNWSHYWDYTCAMSARFYCVQQ